MDVNTEHKSLSAWDVTTQSEEFIQPPSGMSATDTVMPFLIGACGTIGNSLALFIFLSQKNSRKRIANILIINQSVVDLLTSLVFILTYTSHSIPKSYEGSEKYVCLLVDNDVGVWVLMAESTSNLVVITWERYLMVVYPIFYRKHVNRNRIMAIIVFCWILAFLSYWPFSMAYTLITYGKCIPQAGWKNMTKSRIYAMGLFTLYYIIPIASFFFCYSHMLVTVFKRSQVLPKNVVPNSKETKVQQTQMNLTKVMAIVSICFIVCWAPIYTFYLLYSQQIVKGLRLGSPLYRFLSFLCFCNCCINPFIYTSKYDDFKRNLKKILKRSDEATIAASSTQQT